MRTTWCGTGTSICQLWAFVTSLHWAPGLCWHASHRPMRNPAELIAAAARPSFPVSLPACCVFSLSLLLVKTTLGLIHTHYGPRLPAFVPDSGRPITTSALFCWIGVTSLTPGFRLNEQLSSRPPNLQCLML